MESGANFYPVLLLILVVCYADYLYVFLVYVHECQESMEADQLLKAFIFVNVDAAQVFHCASSIEKTSIVMHRQH